MSRHHLMVTYWRDTASPQDALTVTIAGDDPRDTLEQSNARVLKWMTEGLTEEPDDQDDEDEADAETLGLGL